VYWRIRISINGKLEVFNNHRGARFVNEEHAREVLSLIRGELSKKDVTEDGAIAEYKPRRSKPNLVLTLLREFLRDREEKQEEDQGVVESSPQNYRVNTGVFSEYTIASYRKLIPANDDDARKGAHFYWFAGKSIHEVREQTLRQFKKHLERQRYQSNTVKQTLAMFHAFMTWCKAEETISSIPVFPQVKRVKRTTPDLLLPIEQREVLNAIPWAMRGIFAALCLGIRPNAARALRVEDVQRGGIRVRRAVQGRTAKAAVGRHTKGRKENWVPMTRELECWVKEHASDRLPGALLFTNPRARLQGRSWTHDALGGVWRIASEEAGIKHVPLYQATKHSFATAALMRGVSKDAIGAFMQVSREIVDVYAHYAAEWSTQVLDPSDLSDGAREMRAAMAARTPEPWSREAEREREQAREQVKATERAAARTAQLDRKRERERSRPDAAERREKRNERQRARRRRVASERREQIRAEAPARRAARAASSELVANRRNARASTLN
jgi:site-specific recombinase XerD